MSDKMDMAAAKLVKTAAGAGGGVVGGAAGAGIGAAIGGPVGGAIGFVVGFFSGGSAAVAMTSKSKKGKSNGKR